jgi:hypothetical protein
MRAVVESVGEPLEFLSCEGHARCRASSMRLSRGARGADATAADSVRWGVPRRRFHDIWGRIISTYGSILGAGSGVRRPSERRISRTKRACSVRRQSAQSATACQDHAGRVGATARRVAGICLPSGEWAREFNARADGGDRRGARLHNRFPRLHHPAPHPIKTVDALSACAQHDKLWAYIRGGDAMSATGIGDPHSPRRGFFPAPPASAISAETRTFADVDADGLAALCREIAHQEDGERMRQARIRRERVRRRVTFVTPHPRVCLDRRPDRPGQADGRR